MNTRLLVRPAFGFADSTSRVGCLLFVAAPFNWLWFYTLVHKGTSKRALRVSLYSFLVFFVFFFHSSLLLHSSATAFLPYVSCTPHFVWFFSSFSLPIFSRLVTCPSSSYVCVSAQFFVVSVRLCALFWGAKIEKLHFAHVFSYWSVFV